MYGGVQVQAAGGCKVRVQGHFLSHNKHMFIELQEAKIRIDDLCLDQALFFNILFNGPHLLFKMVSRI